MKMKEVISFKETCSLKDIEKLIVELQYRPYKSLFHTRWIYKTNGEIHRIQNIRLQSIVDSCKNILQEKYNQDLILFQDKINFNGGYSKHKDNDEFWSKYADEFFQIGISLCETSRITFYAKDNPYQLQLQHSDAFTFTGEEYHSSKSESNKPIYFATFISSQYKSSPYEYMKEKWHNYPPNTTKVQQNML